MQKLGVIESGVWMDRNAARTGNRTSLWKRKRNYYLGKSAIMGKRQSVRAMPYIYRRVKMS